MTTEEQRIMDLFVKAAKQVKKWRAHGLQHALCCNFQRDDLDYCNCGISTTLHALREHEAQGDPQ